MKKLIILSLIVFLSFIHLNANASKCNAMSCIPVSGTPLTSTNWQVLSLSSMNTHNDTLLKESIVRGLAEAAAEWNDSKRAPKSCKITVAISNRACMDNANETALAAGLTGLLIVSLRNGEFVGGIVLLAAAYQYNKDTNQCAVDSAILAEKEGCP